MAPLEKKRERQRKYPPIYEKAIPIAIVLLAILVVLVLIFTLSVGLGIIRGA